MNMQMGGLLLGGLFGSILLYPLANIANGFMQKVYQ